MSTKLAQELRPHDRSADCSLDRLTMALEEALAGPSSRVGPDVARLLADYASSEDSWRTYASYRDDCYSRNLLWRCEGFELLLLCWNEGQESAIHDHSGQQCWMAVLEGELEEVHFSAPEGGGALERGALRSYPAGGVAYIHDDIALHLIRPKPGTRGISLHLYARPIDQCQAYCGETGSPADVSAVYHSVRGAGCAGTDPGLIRSAWQGDDA